MLRASGQDEPPREQRDGAASTGQMTTAVRKELGCTAPAQGRAGSSCPAQCTVPRHRTREVRAPGATEGQGRAPGGPRGSPTDRVPAAVEDIAQLQHQQRAAWEGGGSVRPPRPPQESWRGLWFTRGTSPQECHPRSQRPPPGRAKPLLLHLVCKGKSLAGSAPSPTCGETRNLTPRPRRAARLVLVSSRWRSSPLKSPRAWQAKPCQASPEQGVDGG